jgi:hypothetical protein
MAARGSFLGENIEKLLFAGAVVCTALYVALAFGVKVENPADAWGEQKFDGAPRSAEVSGAAEFGDPDPGVYLPRNSRIIWVEPRKEAAYVPVELPLPTPTVRAPPVPLPRPGPAFEYSQLFGRMRPGSRRSAADDGAQEENK